MLSQDDFADMPRYLRLVLQRALLGDVFQTLRAVSFQWIPKVLRLRFFVDGAPSEDDLDSVSEIEGEVISCFPSKNILDHVEIDVLDYPMPNAIQLSKNEWFVFHRKEYVKNTQNGERIIR